MRISLKTIKIVERSVRSTQQRVLIVDDDPSHLEIYGLLLKQAGYEPVTALVGFTGADFPTDTQIDGIILDSRLKSLKTSLDLARQIRGCYPLAPIVLLSDRRSLPADMAPYVADFVRRGEPAELLEKLSALVSTQRKTTGIAPGRSG
jgi:DNA-binding response OmpR family regulator